MRSGHCMSHSRAGPFSGAMGWWCSVEDYQLTGMGDAGVPVLTIGSPLWFGGSGKISGMMQRSPKSHETFKSQMKRSDREEFPGRAFIIDCLKG